MKTTINRFRTGARPNLIEIPGPLPHLEQQSYPFLTRDAHQTLGVIHEEIKKAKKFKQPQGLARFGITDEHARRMFNKKSLASLTRNEAMDLLNTFFHAKVARITKGTGFWGRRMTAEDLEQVRVAQAILKRLGIPTGEIHSFYPGYKKGKKYYVVFKNAGQSLQSLIDQKIISGNQTYNPSAVAKDLIDAYSKLHTNNYKLSDAGGINNAVLVGGKVGFIDTESMKRQTLKWENPEHLYNQLMEDFVIFKWTTEHLFPPGKKKSQAILAIKGLIEKYPMTPQNKEKFFQLIKKHIVPFTVDSIEHPLIFKEYPFN